jgi:hypothetical protein
MIKTVLLVALKQKFSAQSFRVSDDDKIVAVFPAAHPQVGDVKIWDDGNEATMEIGKITHGHFDAYGATLSEPERDKMVTEEVVNFLTELFADRVLLWVSESSKSGGWQMLGEKPPLACMREKGTYFLWSGPIKKT